MGDRRFGMPRTAAKNAHKGQKGNGAQMLSVVRAQRSALLIKPNQARSYESLGSVSDSRKASSVYSSTIRLAV